MLIAYASNKTSVLSVVRLQGRILLKVRRFCCVKDGTMDSSIASTSYAAFILTAIFTVPSISRLAKRPWRVKTTNDDGIYKDEDGAATEESMAKFSNKAQFAVILGATGVGLAVSFALAIFATVRRENSFSELSFTQIWLLFPAWVRNGFIPAPGSLLTLGRSSCSCSSSIRHSKWTLSSDSSAEHTI